jgi:tetratricopeptide (TPR) repeat protein
MRRPFLACLAAAAALAAPARADTVRLKNGQVIKGKVKDRGDYVLVHKDLGDVRIDRKEIASIEVEGEPAPAAPDADVVVLLSGDEIEGKVHFEDDGKKVVIVRQVNGQENAVTCEQRQVRTILWSQGAREEAARGGGIAGTVEKLVAALHAEDPAARQAAEDQLADLGVFALPYLERRPADPDPAAQAVIASVVELARVKSYLTPALVEGVPNLARRLVATDPRERLAALKEAVVTSTGDCPPLFAHLVRTPQTKEVRAFLVAQLQLLGRTPELSELLDSQDASLRLAAAIALGDNGIYVGVPVVLEALKLGEVPVRKVAIQKLESWTGQFLGYFADDPPEKRAEAVARWEKWWAESGKKFAEDALRASGRGDEVSEDEKQAAQNDWVRAQKAWDAVTEAAPPLTGEPRKAELEKVRFLLLKALERYPQYVNARLALGILLSAELGDPEGGRRELETVLSRYGAEAAPATRLAAHEHLGRIARATKRWVEADRHYRQALQAGPHDFEVLEELGMLDFERALGDDALGLAEKKAALEDAVKTLGAAIQAVDEHDLEVRESAKAADAVGEVTPFKRGAFLKSLDVEKESLTRRAARLRYERGRALSALGRGDEAYADYAGAAQLVPDDPVYKEGAKFWEPRTLPAPKPPPGPVFRPDEVPPAPPKKPDGGS